MRKIVSTDQAPAAIGPYSQAVVANGMVYCSGQISLTPEGEFVAGDVTAQTEQVMANLVAVLDAAGSSLAEVVLTTIYLADMADYPTVNEIYGSYFEGMEPPARATVAVKELPKGALVEISMIAHKSA